VRLEQSLILNRYLQSLLGVRDFGDLKHVLSGCKDGVGGDGQSHFFHALASQKTLAISEELLRQYDARIMSYEVRSRRREVVSRSNIANTWRFFIPQSFSTA
jgi:hypothetical protein